MISFEQFTMEDGIPIYLQIIRYIKQGIVAGVICDQDEMPSRRVLSSLLGVNPNTIQKAYRILEEEWLIESRSGSGSYVTITPDKVQRVRADLLETDVLALIRSMRQSGMSLEETQSLIRTLWRKE